MSWFCLKKGTFPLFCFLIWRLWNVIRRTDSVAVTLHRQQLCAGWPTGWHAVKGRLCLTSAVGSGLSGLYNMCSAASLDIFSLQCAEQQQHWVVFITTGCSQSSWILCLSEIYLPVIMMDVSSERMMCWVTAGALIEAFNLSYGCFPAINCSRDI